jgi:oligopeptidase B
MHNYRRKISSALACCLLAAGLFSCSQAQSDPPPPVAEVIPKTMTEHGNTRVDNYFWLKERENPKVIDYLKAENAYTEEVMKHTEALQEKLFEEIKGRIKQDDRSVPYRHDEYFYYTRQEDGKEYDIYCRKKGSLDSLEQIILNVNTLAEGHDFCQVAGIDASPDHSILAYGVDTVGRRFYTLHFKDMNTGTSLPDLISDVTGNMVWAADNKTIFYSAQDPETLRWNRIFRHVLGTDPKNDELVYQEPEETYFTWVERSKSRKYLFIHSQQTLADEYRYLAADQPAGHFEMFLPRQVNHEYTVDQAGDRFYMRSNLLAKNFRLMSCAPSECGNTAAWKEEIPNRDDVYLESFELFKNHMVVVERKNGLIQFRVRPNTGEEYYVDFGEPAYDVSSTDNYTFDTPVFRYTYSSMTTPRTVFDYDLNTKTGTVLKVQEVLGGFDKNNYVTERLYAPARDGARVPVSILYRKGLAKDGSHPVLLYGYGAYGISTDASFSPIRLSLVDRGFIYAIAHIRGGQELGRDWYENGKLFHKLNTFTDFIDCGEYLIKEGYAKRDGLFAYGGSAGGLLIGAVMNMRPDLWAGLLADVPYVDVINTMLDASIPLTTNEYDEWGNPENKEYYDYMFAYSPYDNVVAKNYPPLLVMAGLHDSQVQYWEPAKWVAKLRATKTDAHRLLLKTDMEAGHGGASGRYQRYKEYAFMYAFMLDLLGINQ